MKKDKGTAVVLAVLLGGLGFHRFYLNQTLTGIIYLLFCWTFVPLLFALIDAICFLVMSDREWDKKFNSPMMQTHVINHHHTSTADEIAKLHKLREEGAITAEEFEKMKSSLI